MSIKFHFTILRIILMTKVSLGYKVFFPLQAEPASQQKQTKPKQEDKRGRSEKGQFFMALKWGK